MRLTARATPSQAGPGSLAVTVACVALFLVAWIVRLRFHSGFVLGDDAEEYPLIRSLVMDGPSFEGHLRYRFPMWVLNYLAQLVFGNYEASFFLPTWLLSSLLPVLACATLRAAGYGLPGSLFAGAFVALSPFEVLIGGVRANDLFVEFFLACVLWIFVRWQHAPRAQGAGVALALWLAFYAKLWSLFLCPVLGLHYSLRFVRGDRRGLVAFVGTSAVLHGAACAFWRVQLGTWTPFLERLSATYPVPPEQLRAVLLEYPRLIFVGSEHGHTLFGLVPYLLVAGIVLKAGASRVPGLVARAPRIAFDRLDVWLLCSCLVFFGLLNFFPNNFTFDQYYSVPRIFRYLAPLSFGLSLLVGKLLLDMGDLVPRRFGVRWVAALGVLLATAGGIVEAAAPGRSHHGRVAAIREELRASCPPIALFERRQGIFFRELHLREACPESVVQAAGGIYDARDYERWLRELELQLPRDSVVVTGLIHYVYYASDREGFRLTHFAGGINPHWILVRELDPLLFDRAREPIRIWRWSGTPGPEPAPAPVPALAPERLFERGIERFDVEDYSGTRAFMRAILVRFPAHELADDAAYFHAVSYWREQDLPRTIREFRGLIAQFPRSRWLAAAHYHIGAAQRSTGQVREARQAFEAAVASSLPTDPEREYALSALEGMSGPPPLASVGRELTEFVYRFQAEADRLEAVLLATQP